MKITNKKLSTEEVTDILAIAGWIFLGIILIIYILFGCKSLLNSDSTFVVDYALEQINTKSFFPEGWYETNDFWIYSLIPIITPLIKIGFSLFAARQTAVLIQSIVLFILLFKIFYEKKNKSLFLIPGLLIISGISGQVLFEVFGDATYGTIIVYMLLSLYFMIEYLTKNKKRYLALILISITLLTMCSIRFPIYIIAPSIIVLIYLYIINGIKKEYINLLIVFVVSAILGLILNKILAMNLLYVSNFSKMVVATEQELTENFFEILFDYFSQYGATNMNTYSLTMFYQFNYSSNSIFMAFIFVRYIFSILSIIIPIKLSKKIKEMTLKEQIIYIYTVSLTVIIVFFLLIGSMAAWYRYITPVIFFLTLLYIPFYKYFIKEKKVKIIFIILIILFCMYSVVINVNAYYKKDNYYQGLSDFLVENDLSFGYTYIFTEHNLYNFLSEGKLRVVLVDRNTLENYKWLASRTWFEEGYSDGRVFFMRLNDDVPLECEENADEFLIYEMGSVVYYIYVFEDESVLRENLNISY